MTTELEPIIGEWYVHLERGHSFIVVDVDETEGLVEIEMSNGKLQHVDLGAWYEMDLEISEEPDDWLDDEETSLRPDDTDDLDDGDLDDWDQDSDLD